jgi:hypothetical protein
MATPKFDRISVELSRRLNDPVSGATSNGANLTAVERNEFINMALQELFNQKWQQYGGDIANFTKELPELVVPRSGSLAASIYTIASPNLDFKALVSFVVDSKFATIRPAHLRNTVASGRIESMAGSANFPVAINSNGVIYVYPTATFIAQSFTMDIIKSPLDPTTGGYLTQGGSYDSPFSPEWENQIVEIAVELFDKDKGNVR